jgi:Protein of unknown function (DUF3180)
VSVLRWRALLLVALCAAVLSWVLVGALDAQGGGAPPLPWTAPVALLVLACAVVSAGWPVRRWNQGHRDRPLDALRAARAAVLARASAVTGAALAGGYAGLVLVLLPTVDIEPRRARLLLALAAVVASVVLAVAGVVVERWCRLPPRDPDERGRGGSALGRPGAVDPGDGSGDRLV